MCSNQRRNNTRSKACGEMLAATGALSIHRAWFELPGLPSCNQQVITRLHNPPYIHCKYVAFSMTAGSIYTNVYTWDCEG